MNLHFHISISKCLLMCIYRVIVHYRVIRPALVVESEKKNELVFKILFPKKEEVTSHEL